MGFQYKLRISQKTRCREVDIYDETGIYDQETNPFGYDPNGIINPSIAGVTSASIQLIFSDGFIYNGSLYSTTIPFPNTNGYPKTITHLDIGQNPPDGEVNMTSELIGQYGPSNEINGQLGLFRGTGFLICNVECCVRKLHVAALASGIDESCQSNEWKTFRRGKLMLQGLKAAIDCKKFEKATAILELLQDFCSSNNCNCGC